MASPVFLKPMSRVVVCGGTHGNKLEGVYLTKRWMKDPSELRRASFSATPFLVNPPACEKAVRYMDKDINTCFLDSVLSSENTEKTLYEEKRAKEINQMFGPKGLPEAYDLLLDMHSSTSNMGACLLLDNGDNYFAMHLANYVRKHFTVMKTPIYLHMRPKETSGSITSMVRCGISLEMGPQPLGIVRADNFRHMKELVSCCLDFTDKFNQGATFPAFEIEAYQLFGQQEYPLDPSGEISALIHPNVQDKDFFPVNPGDLIFQTFDGKGIPYKGDKTFYPAFVNHPALYEKKIAFVNMEKRHVSIPAIQAKPKCHKENPKK